MFVLGLLFLPFLIFLLWNILQAVQLTIKGSSCLFRLLDVPFQLQRALFLPILIRSALKSMVVVVQLFLDLGNDQFVVIFGLS